MPRSVSVHRVPEIEPELIPDFAIAAHTTAREELLTAVGTLDIVALLLNLDEPDATHIPRLNGALRTIPLRVGEARLPQQEP